ncbi:hypothetical protein PORY_001221 [Pneumocystis oryctolagi]|uniref:Uncharacterized protein n=1 Tax=Pneumocystis oryctolagi TaxID=42067 RepID=A0ACB7CF26_9ASCO|nr:hypothetical protein PORY_001221 [Pneumocystis oryctolagi]
MTCQCAVKKCQRSAASFPLQFRDAQVVQKTLDFNPEFLLNIFYRMGLTGVNIDWNALILTIKELVGIGFNTEPLPQEKPDLTIEHVDMLRLLHTLLLETQVMEGSLVCRNCNHVYPIKEGIPNFLLNEYEVSNFGIPLAAISDLKKDPKLISGKMTSALIIYSAAFARYAWMVSPRNYLLLGCHLVNEVAQIGQGLRWISNKQCFYCLIPHYVLEYHKYPSSNTQFSNEKK